jgi:hypothetical protein
MHQPAGKHLDEAVMGDAREVEQPPQSARPIHVDEADFASRIASPPL